LSPRVGLTDLASRIKPPPLAAGKPIGTETLLLGVSLFAQSLLSPPDSRGLARVAARIEQEGGKTESIFLKLLELAIGGWSRRE
jgi:hypothetical protein